MVGSKDQNNKANSLMSPPPSRYLSDSDSAINTVNVRMIKTQIDIKRLKAICWKLQTVALTPNIINQAIFISLL